MRVILIGTLDTKGHELDFVRRLLQEAGVETCLIDAGSLGEPQVAPDIPRNHVFAAAGTTAEAVRVTGDRGQAVTFAAAGATKVVREQYDRGGIAGVLGIGGSAGTTIATAAMRSLPIGIPKLMVSTLASGQVRPYVGDRDIMMLNSIVDLSGINRISKPVLTNAARAMIGMARDFEAVVEAGSLKPLIAATMFGVTTPCVERARQVLEEAGYEVLVFHATGTGGMTMESLISDGVISGVLDITTTELADELVGGTLSAGPGRLTAAGKRGVPQVISVGALDMVNFGPRESVPEKFKDRQFHVHNANVTLMRTTPEENRKLGEEIANKAFDAHGPTEILFPRQGVSAIDRTGESFDAPAARQELLEGIRDTLHKRETLDDQTPRPRSRIRPLRFKELDLHINDPEFAEQAARTLIALLASLPR